MRTHAMKSLVDQDTTLGRPRRAHLLAQHHWLDAGKLAGETARADATEAELAAVTAAHEQSILELDTIRKATGSEIARYGMVKPRFLAVDSARVCTLSRQIDRMRAQVDGGPAARNG